MRRSGLSLQMVQGGRWGAVVRQGGRPFAAAGGALGRSFSLYGLKENLSQLGDSCEGRKVGTRIIVLGGGQRMAAEAAARFHDATEAALRGAWGAAA